MSKALIERLKNEGDGVMSRREKSQIADRIEELEREVESLKASMYRHYELEAERDALLADNARLRSAINAMLTHMGMDEDEWNKPTFDQAREALAATPAQGLASIRNQVREECAKVLDDPDADLFDAEFLAKAIRAMMEPE